MKRKEKGLTLIEMLVVLGIIATIAGLLIPATQAVRRHAKNTQQRVQFSNIDTALEAWRQDFGDYPASNYGAVGVSLGGTSYVGAQKLAIAMLGGDLRGYHPATPLSSVDALTDIDPFYLGYTGGGNNFNERKERYLDTKVARPYFLEPYNDGTNPVIPGLFATGTMTSQNIENGYVLTDVFAYKPMSFTSITSGETVTERAGSPILYFKADSTGTYLMPSNTAMYAETGPVYQYGDNQLLVEQKHVVETKPALPGSYSVSPDQFYNSILDPLVPVTANGQGMPQRPNSYILISAGADGVYGTKDDIRNFD